MERHTFSWAPRNARMRRASGNAALNSCYDELTVIAEHAASWAAAVGIDVSADISPPIKRSRRRAAR